VFSCNLRILFIRQCHAGQYDCVVLFFSGASENTSNHYHFDMVLVPESRIEIFYSVTIFVGILLGRTFDCLLFFSQVKLK